MIEQEKSLVKSSYPLARFDPKARKELVVRGLNALSEVKDADFYFFKGEEHRMREELKLAISYYEKALVIDPEHEYSLFWKGYCCIRWARIGDEREIDKNELYEKAKDSLENLVAMLEKNDSIWWRDGVVCFNLGIAQWGLGLYEESIESYEQAIELNPEDPAAYYMLGLSQEALGIYHLALENFLKYHLMDTLECGLAEMFGKNSNHARDN